MTPAKLTDRERRALRGRGHTLKPVVLVGKEDLSEAVMTAVGEALTAHELIKVKLLQSCSLDKDDAAKQMASHHGALLVQRVGRTALLYRPNPEDDG